MNSRRAITLFYLAITPFVLFPTIVPAVGVGAAVLMGGCVVYCWRFRPKSPLTLPIAILLIMALIGTATSSHLTLSLPKLLSLVWGIYGWWLFGWWAEMLNLERLLLVYLVVGFAMGLVGMFSADWQPKLFTLTLPLKLSLPGAPLNGISPNQLAGTILFFWPLLLNRRMGLFSLFWLVVLIATQSRTAWFAVLIVLAIYLFEMIRPSRRVAIAMLASVLVVLILWIPQIDPTTVAQAWSSAPIEVTPGSLDSLGMRREIWRWGWAALTDNPLYGVGLGAFRQVIHTYPAILPPNFDIAHAHNLFLQFALDVGLLGFVAYLVLIFMAGKWSWQLLNLKKTRSIGLGFLLTLCAIHVFGILDTVALGSKPSVLFWLLLALIERTHAQTFAPMFAAMAPSGLSHPEKSASERAFSHH